MQVVDGIMPFIETASCLSLRSSVSILSNVADRNAEGTANITRLLSDTASSMLGVGSIISIDREACRRYRGLRPFNLMYSASSALLTNHVVQTLLSEKIFTNAVAQLPLPITVTLSSIL